MLGPTDLDLAKVPAFDAGMGHGFDGAVIVIQRELEGSDCTLRCGRGCRRSEALVAGDCDGLKLCPLKREAETLRILALIEPARSLFEE